MVLVNYALRYRLVELAGRDGDLLLRDGLVADRPMFLLNTPSVLDETMRPGVRAAVVSISRAKAAAKRG